MKYASYSRTSSERQRETATIEMQFDAVRQYATLHEIQIVERYVDDGVSSRIPMEERPDGRRLLNDAANKRFDRLLVFKLDRLARKAQMQLNVVDSIESCGVKVVSITEPLLNDTASSTGAFLRTMIAGVGQFERDTFKERSMAGHYAKARLGQWQGGRTPFGYRVAKDGRLEEEPEHAAVVREIFALYAAGKASRAIVQILQERGIPTPSHSQGWRISAEWHPSTVTRLLRNKTYLGEATWRKTRGVEQNGQRSGRKKTLQTEQVTIQVPPLITPELWRLTLEARESNVKFAPVGQRREYELRGLIRCGICGFTYIGTNSRQRGTSHLYYTCGSGGTQVRCGNKMVRAIELEQAVWSEILKFSQHPELWEAEAKKYAEAESLHLASAADIAAEIEKRIEEAKAARARIISLSRRGAIREDEAVEQLREIEVEQSALEQSAAQYHAQEAAGNRLQEKIGKGVGILRNVTADADAATRTAIMRQLVRRIRISKVEIEGKKRVHAEVEFGVRSIVAGSGANGNTCAPEPALFRAVLEFGDKRKTNGTWGMAWGKNRR